MNTSLLVQTAFETLEQLAEGFADRTTEDQRLMLYGPEPYPVNEEVQFAIYLADGTPGIEGVGRVAASLDGGEDRLPDARWDVVLDSLRLDEWALDALATMVAARRARDGVEVDDGGLDAVEVEVGGTGAPSESPSVEPEPLVSDVDALVESVRPTAPPADGADMADVDAAGSDLPMSEVESLPPDAPDSITAPAPAGDPDPAPPVAEAPELPAAEPPEAPAAESPELPAVETPELPDVETPELPVAETPELPAVETPELPAAAAPAETPELPVAETPELTAAREPEPPSVESPAAPSPPAPEPDRLLVRPTRAPEWTPTPPAPVPPRPSTGAFTYPQGALPAPDAAPRPPLDDGRRIARAPRPVEGAA